MADMTVRITAGTDQNTSRVTASGSVQHIVTDTERSTFGISDNQLKEAVAHYFGKRPNDAFAHSPTPWGDLYSTYSWPQIQTFLTVQSAEITGITSDPVIVATQQLVNTSSKTGSFTANVQDDVSDTVESNWSISNAIDVSQSVSYDVGFEGVGSVGGTTSIAYSRQWGEGGSQSKSKTVGSSEGVSVDLEAGESVVAQLTASRGVLRVRITYIAYLTGSAAVNYNPTYKGHHFWAFDIGAVMQSANISNVRKFVEDIEIGYYSNARVELKDSKGKSLSIAGLGDKHA